MPTISNSTFLDLTSYGTTTATTVEAAYSVSGRPAFQDINVAFILPRANDPSALLSSNWATRQTTLQELRDNGTLWSTYGATASDYDNARSILSGHGTIIGSPTGATDGYVTSQESRTIWVTLTPDGFESLFGTKRLPGRRPLLLERQSVGAQWPQRRGPVVRHRTVVRHAAGGLGPLRRRPGRRP